MNNDDIVSELLYYGTDDWVLVQQVVHYCMAADSASEPKTRVMLILSRLYSDGLMVPGDLGESGFEVWDSPESWLARSRSVLEGLNWEPLLGGFWLCNTPDGDRFVEGYVPIEEEFNFPSSSPFSQWLRQLWRCR